MSDTAPVVLEAAGAEQAPVFANLLELYCHDLSPFFDLQVGPDGRFGYSRLSLYWSEPEKRRAFLIRHGAELAGFILMRMESPLAEIPSPQNVLAADAPRPSSEPPPAFRTVGLSHISYSVADYARSRDFYADLMGWEVTRDDGKSGAVLAIGDVGLMVVRNAEHVPTEGPTGVIDHIAFRIAAFDADAVRTELERRGLTPKRDQGGPPGYDSYHVRDPDGWDLQISN